MDRLYRSRTDRMFAGVAGGLAERLEADPALVRITWAVLVFVTGGLALVVYIIMAFVVPEGSAVGQSGHGLGATAAEDAPGSPPGSTAPARRGNGGGTVVLGLALVVVGGALLLERLVPALDLGAWWPLLLVGLGAILIVGSVRRPS